MPVGSEPVAKDTTRVVLEPASIATTTRSNIGAGAADLGGPGAALSLRSDARWKREGSLVRAFLLLEPAGTEEPDPEDMPLEVWTVEAPWLPARIDGGVLPNLGPPNARGFLRSSPPMTARIDVTRIMLAFAQKRGDDGIAVLAGAVRDHGLGVRTGGAGGAPRLELYVRAQR
jgi:hypothetical protein